MGTDVTVTAPQGTDVVKARKPRAAKPQGSTGKVAPYTPQTEHVAQATLAAAATAWQAGKRGVALAAAIAPTCKGKGCTTGQATFYACRAGMPAYKGNVVPGGVRPYGTDVKGAPRTPAALALAVVAMRHAGNSWVAPRAAFGITEAGVRAAYTAATGTEAKTTGVGAWGYRGMPGQ